MTLRLEGGVYPGTLCVSERYRVSEEVFTSPILLESGDSRFGGVEQVLQSLRSLACADTAYHFFSLLSLLHLVEDVLVVLPLKHLAARVHREMCEAL